MVKLGIKVEVTELVGDIVSVLVCVVVGDNSGVSVWVGVKVKVDVNDGKKVSVIVWVTINVGVGMGVKVKVGDGVPEYVGVALGHIPYS